MSFVQFLSDHRPSRGALARAGAAAVLAASALAVLPIAFAAEDPVVIAPPKIDMPASTAQTETAVFAGGCFWGVQGVFQHVKGVTMAVSGYAGGDAGSATYDKVSGGRTRHAEAVQVTYDPKQVTYGQLLQIYFSVAHDPTQLNRQGPDTGTQYRSALFPANAAQRKVAEAYIAQLNQSKVWPKPIVTTLETVPAFYPAEAYHQDFLLRNPGHPYIAFNDLPKVEALAKLFPSAYRTDAVRVVAAK